MNDNIMSIYSNSFILSTVPTIQQTMRTYQSHQKSKSYSSILQGLFLFHVCISRVENGVCHTSCLNSVYLCHIAVWMFIVCY